MGPLMHQSNWSNGYNNSLLSSKGSSPFTWFGYQPMLHGWIKSRSGLAFCSASVCSPITLRVSRPWNRLLQTLLRITTKRQKPSNGPIPLKSSRKNSKRGKRSKEIEKLLKSPSNNSDRTYDRLYLGCGIDNASFSNWSAFPGRLVGFPCPKMNKAMPG